MTMAQDFKICRLCLSKTTVYFDLHQNTNATMLEAIMNIKIEPLELQTQNIMCLKCRLNLGLAYRIQQNIKKSYAEFENVLKSLESSVQVKEEIEIEYPDLLSVKTKPQCKIQTCHGQFAYEDCLKKHCQSAHSKVEFVASYTSAEGGFQCDVCPASFNSKVSLSRHLNLTHKEVKGRCHVCNVELFVADLFKHLEVHKCNSSTQICHICGKSTASYGGLKIHIRRYHVNEGRVYKCEECGKQYTDNRLLRRHKKTFHGEGPTEVCEICGKKFFSFDSLAIHRDLRHLKTKKFTCDVCKKDFSSPHALRTHERLHSDALPFRCDVCTDGFRHRVSLKTHMSSKHDIEEERNVVCAVCGKKFATQHALMTHQRVHTKR